MLGSSQPEQALEVARACTAYGFETNCSLVREQSGALAAPTERTREVYQEIRALGRRLPRYMDDDYTQTLLDQGTIDWKCRAGARTFMICENGLVHLCQPRVGSPGTPLLEYTVEDIRRAFNAPKPCAATCSIAFAHPASGSTAGAPRAASPSSPPAPPRPPRAPALPPIAMTARRSSPPGRAVTPCCEFSPSPGAAAIGTVGPDAAGGLQSRAGARGELLRARGAPGAPCTPGLESCPSGQACELVAGAHVCVTGAVPDAEPGILVDAATDEELRAFVGAHWARGSNRRRVTINAAGAAHLIVVAVQTSLTPLMSVTDDANNTYVSIAGSRAVDMAQTTAVELWYAASSNAGAKTITAEGNNVLAVVAWEVAGIRGASPLDTASKLGNQPSSTSPFGPSITTSAAGELVVSARSSSPTR